jgi:2-polyprenyl-3-methyl-5-hydroxy-6-metoxy-1,4-benzoquinol methylase
MNKLLKNLADFKREDSLALKMRRKRITIFKDLISHLFKPIKILDVGGTETFWERLEFQGNKDIEVTLINLKKIETHHSNFHSVCGDARDMIEFDDKKFDIVFSNSVIEHVGGYNDQRQMAKEVQRIGKRYFLQTPNFYFPIEPHFLFPCYQFFPLELKIFLLRNFDLGWRKKTKDRDTAIRIINSIRLLKKRELRELFPGATIQEEHLWGFTFSFIIHKGF